MSIRVLDVVGAAIEEVAQAVPRAVERTQAQVELVQKLLASLPCVHAAGRDGSAAPDDGEQGAVVAAGPIGVVDDDGGIHRATSARTAAATGVRDVVAPDVTSLGIPDYDSLAASQVVPRLASLDAAELAAVGDYERAHRGRQTILNRVRQLQAETGSA